MVVYICMIIKWSHSCSNLHLPVQSQVARKDRIGNERAHKRNLAGSSNIGEKSRNVHLEPCLLMQMNTDICKYPMNGSRMVC